MAIDAGTIYSEVRIAIDKLKQDVLAVETQFNKFGTQNTQQSEKIKKSWTSSFKEINLAGVAAFAAIGFAVKQSIDLFAKFEQSLANVRSVSSATEEEFAKLEEAALNAGETTRFTATEAADAMYYLASAGFDATQTMEALNGVLTLAGATQTDLAYTSSIMAATLSQFSLAAEDSADVSNVFSAAIANSQANMEKLGNALKQVGPIAGALGISLEETTSNLEALFNAGFAGQQAGVGLRNILLSLTDSTGPVIKQLEAVGISFEEVNPQVVGLTGAIDVLSKSGVDLTNIFGKRVVAQLLTLTKTGGDALRELQEEITDTNFATEAYATQTDTLSGSMDLFKSAAESAAIKIIDTLSPALRALLDTGAQLLRGFSNLPGPLKLAIGIFAAGIPVVTGFAAAIGIIGGLIGTIAGPITLAVAGVAALAGVVAGINTGMEAYRNRFINAADATETQRVKVEELLKRYNELKGQAKDNKEAQEELKSVIETLSGIVPEAVTKFDEYGNALEINGEKISEFNRNLVEEEITLLELQEEQLKLRKKAAEERETQYNTQKSDKVDEILTEEEIIKLAKEKSYYLGISTEQTETELRLKNEENKAELELLKSSGEFIALTEEQNKVTAELAKVQERLNFLRIQADPELKKKFDEEQKRLKEDEEAKKKQEELDKALDEERRLRSVEEAKRQKEIAEIREEFRRVNLTEEEREIEDLQNLRDKYIGAGIDAEEFYQSRLEEIRQKYRDKEKETDEEKIKKNKEINDLAEAYRQKLESIGKTTLETIEIERERQIAAVEASDADAESKQSAIDALNEYYDRLRDDTANQQFKDQLQSVTDYTLGAFQNLFGALGELSGAITEQRLREIDRQLQAELEAKGLAEQTEIEKLQEELLAAQESGDIETANELQQSIERLRIEQDYEKQKAKIQYQGELQAWRYKLLGALAAAPGTIINAFKTGFGAGFPAGLVLGPLLGAFAIAMTAVQIAAISKAKPQPPSFQTGGLVIPAGAEGTDIRVAENQSPELLLNGGAEGRPFLGQFAAAIADVVATRLGVNKNVTFQLIVDGKKLAEVNANYYNNGIVRLKL